MLEKFLIPQVYLPIIYICVAILINGRIVEPGEEIKLKFKASESVTIMGQSTGRAVQALVQEVA